MCISLTTRVARRTLTGLSSGPAARAVVAIGIAAMCACGPAWAGGQPASAAGHSTVEYLYCTSTSGKVSQFRIGQDGSLHPLKPPSVVAREGAIRAVLSPNRRLLYVIGAGAILQYLVEPDGTLGPQDHPVPFVKEFEWLEISPDRKFAYAPDPEGKGGPDYKGTGVWQYAVTAAGLLKPLVPQKVLTEHRSCLWVAASRAVPAVYAGNEDGTVSQFRVLAGGRLAPLTPAAVPAGVPGASGTVWGVAFDRLGRYAYVSCESKAQPGSDYLSSFRVAKDGGLLYLAVVTAPSYPSEQRHGDTLFVFGVSGSIDQYHIGTGGRLTRIGSPLKVGEFQSHLAFTPNDHFGYLTNYFLGTISQFKVQRDGGLAPLSPALAPTGQIKPQRIVIDPDGRFAYTVSEWDGTIAGFKIGRDGALAPVRQPVQARADYYLTIVRLPAKPAPKTKGKAGGKRKPVTKTKGKAPAKKGVRKR